MKLYYSPGACSLADHIALEEAGIPFQLERVDLKSKRTETGADFNTINPKGYVPALLFDDGEILTENIAILDWVATRNPSLGLEGPLGRSRVLEALAYLSSEVHKAFGPIFHGGPANEMDSARRLVTQRLTLFAARRPGPFLFGSRPTVADFYLFVMTLWTIKFDIAIPDVFSKLRDSMMSRPAVRKAMEWEGLQVPQADRSPQKRTGVA